MAPSNWSIMTACTCPHYTGSRALNSDIQITSTLAAPPVCSGPPATTFRYGWYISRSCPLPWIPDCGQPSRPEMSVYCFLGPIFQSPASSHAFNTLLRHNNSEIRDLVGHLHSFLRLAPEKVPALDGSVGKARNPARSHCGSVLLNQPSPRSSALLNHRNCPNG